MKKMTAKIYKPVLAVVAVLLTAGTACFAQDISVSLNLSSSSGNATGKAKVGSKDIEAKALAFSKDLELSLNNLSTDISDKLTKLSPKIEAAVSDIVSDVDVNVSTDGGCAIATQTAANMTNQKPIVKATRLTAMTG